MILKGMDDPVKKRVMGNADSQSTEFDIFAVFMKSVFPYWSFVLIT